MERITYGVLVTIDTGDDMPTTVYGSHIIKQIIEAGAEARGYKAKAADIEAPITVPLNEVTYQLTVNIERKV